MCGTIKFFRMPQSPKIDTQKDLLEIIIPFVTKSFYVPTVYVGTTPRCHPLYHDAYSIATVGSFLPGTGQPLE